MLRRLNQKMKLQVEYNHELVGETIRISETRIPNCHISMIFLSQEIIKTKLNQKSHPFHLIVLNLHVIPND